MAYGDDNVSVGGLLSTGMDIFRRQAALLLAMGVVGVIITMIQQFLIKQSVAEGSPIRNGAFPPLILIVIPIIFLVLNFINQAVFCRQVMENESLVQANTPLRLVMFAVVGLVYSLAIGFGMVLLIVPGMLALTRWALAANFVLARGMGFSESFRASSEATKGHRGAIFGVFFIAGLIAYAPMIAIWIAGGGIAATQAMSLLNPLSILAHAVTVVIEAFLAAITIGLYATLGGRADQFEDVFA